MSRYLHACFGGAVALGAMAVQAADVWIGLLNLAGKVEHVGSVTEINEIYLLVTETASKRVKC